MFTQKSKPAPTGLDTAIADLLAEMATECGDSPEYAKMADNLVKLYQLRTAEHGNRQQLSPDTVATICANLAGVLIIVGYEQKHALATKALGFVQKLR